MATAVRKYIQPLEQGLIFGFDRTNKFSMFDPHQVWMKDLMKNHEMVLLGAFMGSGKTATALRAFWELWVEGKVKKLLIVAPLNVAKDTWPDEIMDWTFSRDFEYTVLVGTPEQREAAAAKDVDVYIINRENLKWLYDTHGMKYFDQFDVMVYDEASRLKSGEKKTQARKRADGTRTRRGRSEFMYVCKVRWRIKRCWELSGTPCPNGLIDLWGPAYVLDKGAALGTELKAFKARWFNEDIYAHTITPQPHAEAEITERLKGLMYVLKEEDYADLPPLQVRDRWVNLSPSDMKKYQRLQREMALEEYNVEAITNGVLINKLLQLANGSVYAAADEDDPGWTPTTPPEAHRIHERKVEELGSVFEEAGGRPVLIAYSYKFDVHAIKKKYPWVRVYGETANDNRDWNRGRLKGMIMHPASAGHGLNFQHGGNIAVWYGLNWSLELYQQFNKRLHRRGQKGSFVRLYRILARGTADARVADVLEQRDVTQARITDAFRVLPSDIGMAA